MSRSTGEDQPRGPLDGLQPYIRELIAVDRERRAATDLTPTPEYVERLGRLNRQFRNSDELPESPEK